MRLVSIDKITNDIDIQLVFISIQRLSKISSRTKTSFIHDGTICSVHADAVSDSSDTQLAQLSVLYV